MEAGLNSTMILITEPNWPLFSRKIEINLNITSSQMPTGVNQRVLISLQSGSFVLNDKQSDLEELFEKDEVVTYCSIDELKEKSGIIVILRVHAGG